MLHEGPDGYIIGNTGILLETHGYNLHCPLGPYLALITLKTSSVLGNILSFPVGNISN